MAIQMQLYSENNIGFSSQDYSMMDNFSGGGGGGGEFNYQFCFHVQQKQQRQQQMRNQSLCFGNNNNNNNNNDNYNRSMTQQYLESITLQAEKQRQKIQIDHYIRSQNGRLRLVLQEQTKQQLETLLKKIESKNSTLLRQKDEEIAKARNRTMELEVLLKKMEMESQAWQSTALENEATVFSLNNTLEQLRHEASCCFNYGAEDAESCCDVEEETEENRALTH